MNKEKVGTRRTVREIGGREIKAVHWWEVKWTDFSRKSYSRDEWTGLRAGGVEAGRCEQL